MPYRLSWANIYHLAKFLYAKHEPKSWHRVQALYESQALGRQVWLAMQPGTDNVFRTV